MEMRAIGKRIKQLRIAKGFTQQELAEQANISTTHMSVIERGVKFPRLDTFIRIANALEVSADTLLIGQVENTSEASASELSELLSKTSPEERARILNALRALIPEV